MTNVSNIRSSRERPRCSPCLRDLLPRATRGGLRFSRESWERVPGSVSICFTDISFYLGPLISRVEDLYRWMHYHQVLVWHMFLDRRFRSERFLQTQVSSDARIASQKLHEVCTTPPYFSLYAPEDEKLIFTHDGSLWLAYLPTWMA